MLITFLFHQLVDAYGHGEAMELNKDDLIVVAAASLLLGYTYDESQGKKRKKRKCWGKPWIASRETKDAYNILVTELCLTEREDYQRFMRTSHETFNVSIISSSNNIPYFTKFMIYSK